MCARQQSCASYCASDAASAHRARAARVAARREQLGPRHRVTHADEHVVRRQPGLPQCRPPRRRDRAPACSRRPVCSPARRPRRCDIVARFGRLPRGAASSTAFRNSASAASKRPSCARMRARRDRSLVRVLRGRRELAHDLPAEVDLLERAARIAGVHPDVAQSSCTIGGGPAVASPGRLEQAQRLAISLMRRGELSLMP